MKVKHASKIIREATLEDVIQYKRGKKDVNPTQYYLCQCDCGNFWVPSKNNYNKGLSTSCGKHSNDGRIINELNNIYGELTVIAPAQPKNEHRKYWLCQCTCGNQIVVSGKDLREQKVHSCGCVKSKGEKLINKILIDNNISFLSEYIFNDFVTSNNYPYRFDWAIFKNNTLFCLLEYDGKQHFDTNNKWYRQNVDEIKENYCLQHNIPLFHISYKDYKNLSIEFIKKLINYGGN